MGTVKTFLLVLCISGALFCSAAAQCSAEAAKLGTLIKIGEDDGKKVPLVLVHGLQGVKDSGDTAVLDDYWSVFTNDIWKTDKALQAKYALYAFQYCSDRVDVSAISKEFRDRIDAELTDRDHVILAHSMGGLVATAYMGDTVHNTGKWKNKSGGDTTIGLITLATPHHGTPGANSPKTLEKYIPFLYRLFYPRANKLFWESTLGKAHPAVNNSSLPNRSDLRWDNYDLKFERSRADVESDVNIKLFERNRLFAKYSDKLIAYSGHLETVFSGVDALEALNEMISSGSITTKENKHRVLDMANYFFINGLSNSFKPTDGLVPFDSGLLCESGKVEIKPNSAVPKNFICLTSSRVRRFEPAAKEGAKEGLVAKTQYPDKNTLSIFLAKKGFDHLDMLENKNVLSFVAADLKAFTVARGAGVAGAKFKK